MDRSNIRALLVGAAVIDVVFPLTVIILDVIEPIDPVRRTLSLHALRDGFPWMAFAFLAHALALELLAAALRRLPPRPYGAPVMLRLAGGASALLAIFSADEPGTETAAGHLHEAVALVAFMGISVAAFFAAHSQRSHPAWKGLWMLPAVCACALLGTLAALGLLVLVAQVYDPAHGLYGAAERLVVACIGAWFVSTAVQGVRVTLRPGGAVVEPGAPGPGKI